MVAVAWSTSNLKLFTHRDGSAKVCETCCADEIVYSGDDCEYCTAGTTPTYVTLHISGVAACTCGSRGTGKSVKLTAGNPLAVINGSHVLPQTGPNCWYYKLIDVRGEGIQTTRYENENCSGNGIIEDIDAIIFVFRIYAGNLLAYVKLDIGGNPRYLMGGNWLYSHSAVCGEALWENMYSQSTCGEEDVLGDGGICIVEPGSTHPCADANNWNNFTTYSISDYVRHTIVTRVCYRCILGHIDKEPPNATYWIVADYP